MYTKIINPAIHGKTAFKNIGSCGALVNYLNKENRELQLIDRELFFDQSRKNVTSNEVQQAIDNNHKGLRRSSPKFHSLVIAPSAQELSHIKQCPQQIKEYTRLVMDQYAKSFNLPNCNKLSSDDLVWFAKLEYKRNGDCTANSMHVHIIVSARDRSQAVTLNPNINNRRRFNRVQFYLKSEREFDLKFTFNRKESLLCNHQINKYGSVSEKLSKVLTSQRGVAKSIQNVFYVIQSMVFEYDSLGVENEEDNVRKVRRNKR